VDLGQAIRHPPVHLFRVRAVDVVGPESRLHVRHGDHPVVGSQGGGEGRGSVAVHQDQVWPRLLEERVETGQDRRRDVPQGLPLAHDLEIVIHGQLEVVDDLVQHLPMLAGQAGDHTERSTTL